MFQYQNLMTMRKYKYTNSTSARVQIGDKEVFFQEGNTYELPSENAYIASLIEQGHLVPLAEKPTKFKKEK